MINAAYDTLSVRWLSAAFVALLIAMLPQATLAQTAETIDWTDAGVANQGAFPSPRTVIGSDGNTATVTWSANAQGGNSWVPVYGNFVSYLSGTVGTFTGPLAMGFDNRGYDPRDKITVTINLNTSVQNLQFSLLDVDNGSWVDAVEVYYDTGTGVFNNAATNTALWSAGTSAARTNDATVNGWRGVAGADNVSSAAGNVDFNFSTTTVKQIRIVYFSYTGDGDPLGQVLGLSDLGYGFTGADLSLAKSLLTASPGSGDSATYRLTLSNSANSTEVATGVQVLDTLPNGFSFTSSSGSGSFDPATGIWTPPSLAPGGSVTMDITGNITATAGALLTNVAEVIASDNFDADSTPNNNVTTEDDYDTASFTVAGARTAGTPPVLNCPNSNVIFDWDAIAWTAGSTSNSYPLGTLGNISFSLSNPGLWLNNAAAGGQSPANQNVVHGGSFQNSLIELVDLPSSTSEVTTTINLPAIMQGVQFSIFDVDYAAGQFADRVEVVGERGGVTVLPTLTNGVANYVIGNEAFGDGNSDSDQPDGTVIVTFSDPIDRIIIRYGNHSLSPANPGQQGVSIHDFNFCNPYTELSATKVSSVLSDPVNGSTNPKNIPGALIEYAIGVSNTGISPVDDGTVSLADIVPSETKMCVTDIGGNGPVVFTDGNPSSNLTYTYTGLTNTADDLDFSSDGGATWGYAPVADADGCDTEITHFRVQPSGAFAASGSFTLNARFIVE